MILSWMSSGKSLSSGTGKRLIGFADMCFAFFWRLDEQRLLIFGNK
jgi:hypothetical protein